MTKKVMIDPGHGGKDPGAQGNGLSEEKLTLAIAKLTKEYLESYEGVEVEMTRREDRFLELSERAELANGAGSNLFVSIHINSSSGTAGDGFESYIYNGTSNPATQAAQNIIHAEILRTGLFKDRGKKRANFAVLRDTNMPAILTENGFINNPSNAKILKDDANIRKIAGAHTMGIAKFLGLTKAAGANIAPAKGSLYKVQVGAFADQANAAKLVNDLESKGYKPFIVEE